MTNIGVSHIEFMKTRENIMKEKFGITDYLPNGSKVFVNGDDDLLSTLKSTPEKQIVRFGLGENCDWRAVELEADTEGTRFICVHDGKREEMYVPAAGEHNVRNALPLSRSLWKSAFRRKKPSRPSAPMHRPPCASRLKKRTASR